MAAIDLRDTLLFMEITAILLVLIASLKVFSRDSPKAKQAVEQTRPPRCGADGASETEPWRRRCDADGASRTEPWRRCGADGASETEPWRRRCGTDEGRTSCKTEPRRRPTPKTRALVDVVHTGDVAQLPTMLRISCMQEREDAADGDLFMEERCSDLVQAAMLGCVSHSLFQEAMSAFEAAEDLVGAGTKSLWSVLLFVAAKVDDAERGLSAFEKLRGFGEPSGKELFNVVRCSMHKGDLSAFKELLRDLKAAGVQLNAITRAKVLEGCTDLNRFGFASALLVSGICAEALDSSLFESLKKRCSRRGFADRCIKVDMLMKACGVEPTGCARSLLSEAAVKCEAG